MADYDLYYWPTIQGRGEFVRLALEDADVPYRDVAREGEDGLAALLTLIRGETSGARPFAPPILQHGDVRIWQTAAILAYLGPRHGLAPGDEPGRIAANCLQLTLADFVSEVHDTHHPIGSGLYYEQQKHEARRRTAEFRRERIGKFLQYFESHLERGDGVHLLPGQHTYVDLTMFQTLEGLDYAFPRGLARMMPTIPKLAALRARVRNRPYVARYLASDRRVEFNEEGIFRRYPELDIPG